MGEEDRRMKNLIPSFFLSPSLYKFSLITGIYFLVSIFHPTNTVQSQEETQPEETFSSSAKKDSSHEIFIQKNDGFSIKLSGGFSLVGQVDGPL